MIENIYLPHIATITQIKVETDDIKTFTLSFKDELPRKSFSFRPGQFMMVSVPHGGEMPISISSSPTEKKTIELSIKKVGSCTRKIHEYEVGAEIGLRGPYGRSFPLERLTNKNLLFVAGGIGLAPLRGLINYVLENRPQFGHIIILHGARTPSDIPFKGDLLLWSEQTDVEVLVTVDRSTAEWGGNIGPVTSLWPQTKIVCQDTIGMLCGPPAMISAVINDLTQMGFSEDDIISTLERHMKCGVGKCGHCSIGQKLTCLDGPVFTYREMQDMPKGM